MNWMRKIIRQSFGRVGSTSLKQGSATKDWRTQFRTRLTHRKPGIHEEVIKMDAVKNTNLRRSSRAVRHPVRLTALLYLSEALRSERYEECTEFVQVAQEFGATQNEIRSLLEDPRRVPSRK